MRHWLQGGGGGWFVYSAVESKIRKQHLEKSIQDWTE